jgi:hypothetical protein
LHDKKKLRKELNPSGVFFIKLCSRYGEMMRGKRENFFSREKKFSLSPRAPLTLSRKAKKLFYLLLPTFVGNRAKIFAICFRVDTNCPLADNILCPEAKSKRQTVKGENIMWKKILNLFRRSAVQSENICVAARPVRGYQPELPFRNW